MNFLNWYDWIQPTNPFASIFFGLIFTVIISSVIWLDTKTKKTASIALVAGVCVTVVGVTILNAVGFYG
ncbi:hypothetical protein CEQ21_02615 [Niallia circulans]|uniref:Uncharacterized protein n=1 Tax=Niallia circulans TaxID=1397 RepID=A0A553SS84_NIACI|nr:hypothetical protein [Niallia circulans]TRZ39857.1 hypothetical protein CEQ21_02615 [Niallia circulans]